MELLPTAPFPTTTALMAISRSSSSISELYYSRVVFVDRSAIDSLDWIEREGSAFYSSCSDHTLHNEFGISHHYVLFRSAHSPISMGVVLLARGQRSKEGRSSSSYNSSGQKPTSLAGRGLLKTRAGDCQCLDYEFDELED
jgi:hypothetical protein